MKNYVGLIFSFAALQFSSLAAITIPEADGSDGALSISVSTTIDLSQAVTGNWDDDNSASAGAGIYDSNKWAVVFKYSSVTIDAPVHPITENALTFNNHPSRAPVVWLVDGDVTINGTLNISGESWKSAPALAQPGPGGFRGGMGYYASSVGASAGFGPGGGKTEITNRGFGGSHASAVTSSPVPYGNPSLVPLLGGSGGGGGSAARGGGAGGGALLIACSGTLTINGKIMANGGAPNDNAHTANGDTGGGSGGGIRLIADTMVGTGTIEAKAGAGGSYPGSLGRIRVERVNNNNTWTAIAPEPSVVGIETNDTVILWPTTTSPTVEILSIGGEAAGGDPLASFGTAGADVSLGQTNSVQVLIQTAYVEQASEVKIRLTPRANLNYTEITASVNAIVSTDPLVIQWVADVPVDDGYSAIQVHVIRP